MNNIKIIVMFSLILFSPFLFSGCDSDSSEDSAYKIEFTLDGTLYSFTGGYDDPSGVAEGCMRDGGDTFIAARNVADTSSKIFLRFETTTPDIGTYNDTSPINFSFNSDVWYNDSISGSSDFKFIITEYGDVGGVIRGTFTGTATNDSNEYLVENGFFEVKRKPDNSVASGG